MKKYNTMDNKTGNKETIKLSIFDSAVKVIPTFVEKENSGKAYLNYGVDNQFPNYLWELYLRSAILQSIINGTADYAGGNKYCGKCD